MLSRINRALELAVKGLVTLATYCLALGSLLWILLILGLAFGILENPATR
jgi:hypothetical protein